VREGLVTTPEEFADNGSISFRGPVSGVTVHAHMRSGPHGLTEYPLDLTVAVELMFLFAEQARRGPEQKPLVVTPQSVLEHLKSIGIRSGNGSRLVGRDAVYESFARLRGKGYIRRIFETKPENGQRTGVAYEFYDWPAWNPDAPTITDPSTEAASVQVGATSGNAGSGNAGTRSGERTKSRSPQVKPISGNAVSGNAGNRETSQVGATSGNAVSPPHPPEEEDSSSPYPLTDPTGSLPSQREEEAGDISKEETAAAELFLQQMKRWQAGAATARKCAPRLLRVMRAQGWPTLTGLDDEHLALLEAEILKNTRGAVSWAKCLPGWVDDLRLYDRARSRLGSAGGGERCPDHPARYRTGCIDCAMAVPD
jgi:hypothetical protein